jgi:hypothetical protein
MYSKKYIPNSLSDKDKKKQRKYLNHSIKKYKNKKYFTRPKLKSYKSKKSRWLSKAQLLYNIKNLTPNKSLAVKTKCSIKGLKEIIKKGKGAYYSSGSRPNQTPQSWGVARLGSSICGGPASKVDYHILQKYCEPNSKALKLANKFIKDSN